MLPLLDGVDQFTVADVELLLTTAVPIEGAEGTVNGVTALELDEVIPLPAELVAVTVKT